MDIGVLYNVVVCFFAGGSGVFVFWKINSLRSKKKVLWNKNLDYFLLFFGLLWLSVGLRNLFFWLGFPELDMLSWKWFVGPLTYLHILPLFYFYGNLFFYKKKNKESLFSGIFTLVSFAVVTSLFIYGFDLAEVNRWGTKYDANMLTHAVFVYGIFIPAIICILADLVRKFNGWRKKGNFYYKQFLAINVGFLTYAMVAVFDGLALAKGVTLLLVRIGIMVSAMIIYYFVTEEPEEDE